MVLEGLPVTRGGEGKRPAPGLQTAMVVVETLIVVEVVVGKGTRAVCPRTPAMIYSWLGMMGEYSGYSMNLAWSLSSAVFVVCQAPGMWAVSAHIHIYPQCECTQFVTPTPASAT